MADFDFGNILYLIALILFAVLGSRKKKKPRTAPSENFKEQENSETTFFEKILSGDISSTNPRFEYNNEDVVYEDGYSEENVADKNKEVYQTTKSNIQPQVNYQVENLVVRDDVTSETVTLTTHEKLNELLGGPFDLEKAVIYSEILKRKHF